LPPDANITTFYNNINYYCSQKAFISKKIFGDYIKCEVIPYIENERRRIGKMDARAIILVYGHFSHHDELLESIFAEKKFTMHLFHLIHLIFFNHWIDVFFQF